MAWFFSKPIEELFRGKYQIVTIPHVDSTAAATSAVAVIGDIIIQCGGREWD
jgi:hypothetical protein